MRKSLEMLLFAGSLIFPTVSFSDALDRQKILTASAGDYAETLGKKLSEYSMFGLYGVGGANSYYDGCLKVLLKDASKLEAEAVTDFRQNLIGTGTSVECYGTALVPKK